MELEEQNYSNQESQPSGVAGQGQWSYGGGPLAEDLEAVRLGLLLIRADIADLHVAVRQPAATASLGGEEIQLQRASLRNMLREELKDIAKGRLHKIKRQNSWPADPDQRQVEKNVSCDSYTGSSVPATSDIHLSTPYKANKALLISRNVGLKPLLMERLRLPSTPVQERVSQQLTSWDSATTDEQYLPERSTEDIQFKTGLFSCSPLSVVHNGPAAVRYSGDSANDLQENANVDIDLHASHSNWDHDAKEKSRRDGTKYGAVAHALRLKALPESVNGSTSQSDLVQVNYDGRGPSRVARPTRHHKDSVLVTSAFSHGPETGNGHSL
jgi:hypothetical protein